MKYTVSEVARLSGVTVRTLHHYDEIGLVSPGHRSEAGYRIYERGDLERLQEVLVLKELDLPLDTIRDALDGASDRNEVLRAQLGELTNQRERIDRIIATVELTLMDTEGDTMTDKDLFGGFDPAEYEDEVKERWGDTDAYRESARRTKRYSADDWKRMGEELGDAEGAMAALLVAGVPADSVEAMDLAERKRLHIDKWFYPCSHAMHSMLAEGYVTDPRFKKHYEDRQEGLADYVRAAIVANQARH